MWPSQGTPSETGGGKEQGFPLGFSEGVWPCQHSDFRLLASSLRENKYLSL
jgi:hypothetical protein